MYILQLGLDLNGSTRKQQLVMLNNNNQATTPEQHLHDENESVCDYLPWDRRPRQQLRFLLLRGIPISSKYHEDTLNNDRHISHLSLIS